MLLLLMQVVVVHDRRRIRSGWSAWCRARWRWSAVRMWGNTLLLLLLLDAGVTAIVTVIVVGRGRARGGRRVTRSTAWSCSSRWGRGCWGGGSASSASLLLLLRLRRLYFFIHGCCSSAAPDLPDVPDAVSVEWRPGEHQEPPTTLMMTTTAAAAILRLC